MVKPIFWGALAGLVAWGLLHPCWPKKCSVEWSMLEDEGVFLGK